MLTPFQRLLYCSRARADPGYNLNVLLAASGPSIRTFNASDGTYISKWSHLEPESQPNENAHDRSAGSHAGDDASEEPYTKRRKLENEGKAEESEVSVEVVVEEGSGKKKKRKRKAFQIPSVVNLTATADGKHVVAVTGEDKSVRVLELLEDGSLKQISQRIMPKRPSAITLSPSQTTIICADKFGDVYGMPLLWSPDSDSQPADSSNTSTSALQFSPPPPRQKPSGPSASTSTVHSRKNLIALQMQQRQFARKAASSSATDQSAKSSPTLSFPHQLLLGHVSLLTDIVSLSLTYPTSDPASNPNVGSGPIPFEGTRSYILTSDRDEHIRVSRGIPQAHIIENYCLGHGQFISRLHIPAWKPEVLISGGGDDAIFVWDWLTGEKREELDIRGRVQECRKAWGDAGVLEMEKAREIEAKEEEETDANGEIQKKDSEDKDGKAIAVSGIWSVQTGDGRGEVIVACEAVPALLVFKFGTDGSLTHGTSLPTEGNVLDVSIQVSTKSIAYSMDCMHVPWSTNMAALATEQGDGLKSFVGYYRFNEVKDEWVKETGDLGDSINAFANADADPLAHDMDVAAVSDLLYGIEHLRKRAMADGEEEDGD